MEKYPIFFLFYFLKCVLLLSVPPHTNYPAPDYESSKKAQEKERKREEEKKKRKEENKQKKGEASGSTKTK